MDFEIDIPSNAPTVPSFDEFGNEIKTVEEYLRDNRKVNALLDEIEEYNIFNTTYNQFRTGKRFYCENVVYNEFNGRIKNMTFREI